MPPISEAADPMIPRTPQDALLARSSTLTFEAIRTEFEIPARFPPEVLAETERAIAGRTPRSGPLRRPHRRAVRDDRPGIEPRSRPGLSRRPTAQIGLPHRLRDRRPRRLREPRWGDRSRNSPTWCHSLLPRQAHPASPGGFERGRRQPLARRSTRPAIVWQIDLDSKRRARTGARRRVR